LGRLSAVFRRFLWLSLVLAPIVVVLSHIGVGDVTLFVVAAAALIPLAWLIGEATEHAAHHTAGSARASVKDL
jgi:Ca2+:H+ antiporter